MDRSGTVFLFGMGQGTFTAKGGTWKANIHSTAIVRQVPISEWWNQVVFISGKTEATRKSLVLTAADRDGGRSRRYEANYGIRDADDNRRTGMVSLPRGRRRVPTRNGRSPHVHTTDGF